MERWRAVLLSFIAVALAVVTIAGAVLGYRIAAGQQNALEGWRARVYVIACSALPLFFFAILPWVNDGSSPAGTFSLLSCSASLSFFLYYIQEANSQKHFINNQPSTMFYLIMALLVTAWCLVSLMKSIYKKHENEEKFYTNDFSGPSRIVGWNAGDGGYDMQLEWPCQDTVCQYEVPGVLCSFYHDTNIWNQKSQTFYYDNSRLKYHVYNVEGLDCSTIPAAVASDYDAYASPKKDGSPYVDILGNCTTCSARLLVEEYSQQLRRPRVYACQSVVFGCLAVLGYVWTVITIHRRRKAWSEGAAVELVPAEGTIE